MTDKAQPGCESEVIDCTQSSFSSDLLHSLLNPEMQRIHFNMSYSKCIENVSCVLQVKTKGIFYPVETDILHIFAAHTNQNN